MPNEFTNKTLDEQIAIAIPTEAYYRDAYKEMAIESERVGDTETKNTVNYISGDEDEHYELLRAAQCRRQPEKCQYGPKYENIKGDHLMNDRATIAEAMGRGTIREAVHGYTDPPPGGLGESVAAEHFGRAICLGPGSEHKLMSELSPEQQKCVQEVGMGWENAIVSRFETRTPATTITENAGLVGNNGQRIGTLGLNNGLVTLCFNTGKGPKCGPIGAGFDSFVAAQQILDLMGVKVQPSGG